MGKKYSIILFIIAVLVSPFPVVASEQNMVGVRIGGINVLGIDSSIFEAGEYNLQNMFIINVWNWPDGSGESVNRLEIVIEPIESGLINNIEVEGGTVLSKDPYTIFAENIPMDSGVDINIQAAGGERVDIPVSVERNVDISYFEMTGTQLVTVRVRPESDMGRMYVSFELIGNQHDYQELADVELLSTSKDYFQESDENGDIRFMVGDARKGEEYIFKIELQVTPKKGKVTYIPNVFVAVGGGEGQGDSVVGNNLEMSTDIGNVRIMSDEEVNFRIEGNIELGVHMNGVVTTTRFLDEKPAATPSATPVETSKSPTTAPPSPSGQEKPAPPNINQVNQLDSDGDGWTDEQERRAGTNPFVKDTDGDGSWDSKDPNPLVSEGKNNGVDWDQIAVILAITGAVIGGFLSRRKRGRVKKLLDDIDRTYEGFRMNSRRCEAELYRYREIVSEQLKKGKISEESYSILDKRIGDYLGEIRERIMEEKVGSVPAGLKEEVHHMLEDGEISEKDYKVFENLVGRSRGIGKKDKSELKDLLRKWRDEDRITGSVLDRYIDDYIKDVGVAEGKTTGIELKAEIDRILEDGIVTEEEFENFSKMLDRSDLEQDEKHRLKSKLRKIMDMEK